jgi:hypothetical protein
MTPARLLKLVIPSAALAAVAACSTDPPLTAPEDGPPTRTELRGIAIPLTVDVAGGRVTVSTPAPGPRHRAGEPSGVAASDPAADGGPSFALLGASEVGVTTSNFSRSAVGEFLPEKVRVRFDVALTNRLAGAAFVTPTFPRPPLGERRLLLFPFSISQINDIGEVAPSTDWDAAPHNFFNDPVCGAGGGSDCYRYEPYPSPLGPGATSEARTIGFDIDPQVRTFQLDLLLAADVATDSQPPQQGSVGGTVSSPERGPLPGVTVTAAPGGQSTVTDTAGAYLVANLPAGSITLTLDNLPAGCTDPGPQTVIVPAGGTATRDFSLGCTPADGASLRGQVLSDRGDPLAGVTVAVSPGGQSATTGADGRYVVGISAATVTISLSGLPAGCLDPGPRTVSPGFGGAVDPNFSVPCPGPEGATLTGAVRSDGGDPLAGVTVTASPGGQSAATGADGRYTIAISAATVTLALGNLPAGCLDPGPRTISPGFGGAVNPDFSVPCPGVAGATLTGTVASDQGDRLGGVTVTVSPGGQSAVTGADGRYVVSISAATVTLALSNLPSGCLDPGPRTISPGFGGAVNPNFSVPCPGPEGATLTGAVRSDRGDPIAGVTVAVTPGGQSGVTDASGRYAVGISAATVTLALGNLPAGCLDPGPRTISPGFGGAVNPDFSVPCPGVAGATLQGDVFSDRGGPLAGVTVTATPGGQSAVTDADGRYAIGVSAATVTLALGNLPAGCLDPGPRTLSPGFGGAVDPNFLVPCPGSGGAATAVRGAPATGRRRGG